MIRNNLQRPKSAIALAKAGEVVEDPDKNSENSDGTSKEGK